MADVDSGLTTAKKTAKQKPKPRKSKQSQRPALPKEKKVELSQQPVQSPSAADGSAEPSQNFKSGFSAETVAELDKIPNVIGGEAAPGSEGAAANSADAGMLSMLPEVFDEGTVRTGLIFAFDWIADARGEHFRLDEDKLNKVASPTTAMANQAWASIRNYLPTLMTKAIESNPALIGFCMAWGIVLTPMVLQDLALRREQAAKQHEWRVNGKEAASGTQHIQQ